MEKRGFKSRLLRKYRLTIHNVNKPDNVRGFYTSPILLILSLFIAFMLVAGVLYLVVIYTPVGSMLPGYVNKVEKDKIVTNSLRVDSLMHEIEKQDAYLANIRAIMDGDITLDSLKNSPQPVSGNDFSVETTELEAEFVKNW